MVSFLTQPLPFYLLLPPPSSPLRPTLPLSISLSSSFLSSSPKSSRDLEKANHRASNMSCNGCRVLRKGCSENCTLRTSLQWIQSPESQGHATLFVAKFFGRADLMSFISAVPHHQRPALFQSLLFEACGRTVNPVNGAVGLLCSGNWHICQAAVQTVLSGGVLRPIAPEVLARVLSTAGDSSSAFRSPAAAAPPAGYDRPRAACGKSSGFGGSSVHFQAVADLSLSLVGRGRETTSFESEVSEDCFESGDNGGRRQEVKLLNLFV